MAKSKNAEAVVTTEDSKFVDLSEVESLKAQNLLQQGVILEQAIGIARRDLETNQFNLKALEEARNNMLKELGSKYLPGVTKLGITQDGKRLVNVEALEAEELAKQEAAKAETGPQTVN